MGMMEMRELEKISTSLQRIEKFLKKKEDKKSIHEHRIGALKRISEAIHYMNSIEKNSPNDPNIFRNIKDLLLGR